jgi:hypothetical protein
MDNPSVQSGRHVQVVFKEPVEEYTNFTGVFMFENDRGITIMASNASAASSKFIPWDNIGYINVLRERE